VLGGATGGTADAVDHGTNGWLIDASDPDELVRSIRTLHDDDVLRRRMAEAGPGFARSRFDWEDISRRIRRLGAHA